MIVIMIVIPIVLSFPSMFFPVPPLMMLPTTLPFGMQFSPPFIRFAAVLAPVMDRPVQSGFRLFDGMSALLSFIGLHEGCCYK
jgi:hypothetical protein